jgi:glycosidase
MDDLPNARRTLDCGRIRHLRVSDRPCRRSQRSAARRLEADAAAPSPAINFAFDPGATDVESAEIFTNLNRRTFAIHPGAGGVEEGIQPPPGNAIKAGDDGHYFRAYPMELSGKIFKLALNASLCGAYRATARYRKKGDPTGTYRWYGDEKNANGFNKRDHAIVVSPDKVHGFQLYELNPLTIAARGPTAKERSTFADLAEKSLPADAPDFSLDYIRKLGLNAIWLQPIHPRGEEGRQIDPDTKKPFELGSPYSVRNFFAVMPIMSRSFNPTGNPADDDTAAGRSGALEEFRKFVNAADAVDVAVFLDAPFNHTAPDVELGEAGQRYWGNASSNPLTQIRAAQPRVFSRLDTYDMRAPTLHQIAPATDRYDFSKFRDVSDVYFGRYSALVPDVAHEDQYKNEADRFDYSIGPEDGRGEGKGHFDRITQAVWGYFGDYVQYWLDQTGYPANPSGKPIDSHAGIDGLRADFAQGLPPQAWEYIINRTRARKWDFVFMAETLDGGPVSYRSSRHFDLLNENLIYALHHALKARDFQQVFEQRLSAYGGMPILLNTTSQDEDNYKDPFQAFIRYAVNNTMQGVPMIFPGQELDLTGTIVPPHDSNSRAGRPRGYDRFEGGFSGKPIPHFKKYNSMMPLWNDYNSDRGQTKVLHALYAAVGNARHESAALKSAHYAFLKPGKGSAPDAIFAVAKFQIRNGDSRQQDIVFSFVNLTLTSNVRTAGNHPFDLNIDADRDGRNDFGIQANRLYNLKNIASLGPDKWFLPKPLSGKDLLARGLEIHLNRLPVTPAQWSTAPFEPLFLKLYDVGPA